MRRYLWLGSVEHGPSHVSGLSLGKRMIKGMMGVSPPATLAPPVSHTVSLLNRSRMASSLLAPYGETWMKIINIRCLLCSSEFCAVSEGELNSLFPSMDSGFSKLGDHHFLTVRCNI